MPKSAQLSKSKRQSLTPETIERIRRDLAGMERLMTMQLKLLRAIGETLAPMIDDSHSVPGGHR